MNDPIFPISEKLQQLAARAEQKAKPAFERIEQIEQYNGQKVLKAFIDNNISAAHLVGTTGYGYGDIGRDALDRVFAAALGTEDALVRHTFASGTHTLTVGLFGLLRTGDTLLSITGKPYDTLEEVIGIRDNGRNEGSLAEFGIKYAQTELKDGKIDLEAAAEAAKTATVAYIQRSRGYSLRDSFSSEEIGEAVKVLKAANPNVIVMVDNCYGEFVEMNEPTAFGADLIAGSLIKNPGGGIAKTGGYLAGRHDLVERCACRLTSPGTGREVGCSLDELRSLYLGLFMAPTVTAGALKGAIFAANIYEKLGFRCVPNSVESRHDIIQAVELGSEEAMVAFCAGIQAAAPVDSYVTPVPWAMPGYDNDVIMAAGAFIQGSSIELSADGPIREPYAVYFQGGLTWYHAKLGILMSLQKMFDAGLVNL